MGAVATYHAGSLGLPCIFSGLEKPGRRPDCDNLCHQVLVAEPESRDRPEITGLSVVVQLVELGGIETQKSVRDVRLDR